MDGTVIYKRVEISSRPQVIERCFTENIRWVPLSAWKPFKRTLWQAFENAKESQQNYFTKNKNGAAFS